MGKWPEDADVSDTDVAYGRDAGEQLLLELDAAAVQCVAHLVMCVLAASRMCCYSIGGDAAAFGCA